MLTHEAVGRGQSPAIAGSHDSKLEAEEDHQRHQRHHVVTEGGHTGLTSPAGGEFVVIVRSKRGHTDNREQRTPAHSSQPC